jgi:hypothetical protein
MLFWDNLRSGMKIGGPALDCVLTTRRLNDRVLGESKSESYQWDTVVVVSSNNPCYRGDTSPRTQPIGFQSDLEHPELRSGWKHPDLAGWVRQNRGQLLWAVLTIARGYAAAGMPDQRLPAWGSYEAYTKIVRGALVWAGYSDPASVRVTDRDVEVDFVATLLEGLRVADKDGAGLSTRQIIEKAQFGRNEVLSAALATISPPNMMISPDSLGKHLSQHQGRNVGGWRIASRKKHGGVCVWFAERILLRAA